MGINLSKASLQCLQCEVTTYGNWRATVTSPSKAKMKNWQLTMRLLHAFDSNECVFLYNTRSPLSSDGLCPLLLKWHQGMFSFLWVLGCPLRWIKGIPEQLLSCLKSPLVESWPFFAKITHHHVVYSLFWTRGLLRCWPTDWRPIITIDFSSSH